MVDAPPFSRLAPVVLSPVASRLYVAAKGLRGVVQAVEAGPGDWFACVDFEREDGSKLQMRDIPARYLRPAPVDTQEKKPARRGALNLHGPKDTRNEADRLNEGVAWLRAHGYEVWTISQGAEAAICHACSRRNRERGNNNWHKIKCNTPMPGGGTCGCSGFTVSTMSTKGVPDTMVSRADWGGVWLGVEWKDGPQPSKHKPEQQDLYLRGKIAIVWDLATCLAAVIAFEKAWGFRHDAEALAYVGARHAEYLEGLGRGL